MWLRDPQGSYSPLLRTPRDCLLILQHHLQYRRRSFVYFTLAFIAVLGLISTRHPAQRQPTSNAVPLSSTQDLESSGAKLRLLITADVPNAELCRTLLSASILNYTAPVLINWSQHAGHETSTSSTNITSVLNYLSNQGPEFDEDLVLIIDGSDSWFQFSSEVITSRYRRINDALLARTKSVMGDRAVTTEGIKQSIVFSAQKVCESITSDRPWDQISCYAQPESLLPKDLYGPEADTHASTNLPYSSRPRWLDSGVMMGPIGDIRMMYKRASEKIDVSQHVDNGQAIFNEIFGEQNYQRDVIRLRWRTSMQRFRDSVAKTIGMYLPGLADLHPTHVAMEHLPGKPLEFGIGLDYGLEISQSPVFSNVDASWFTFIDSPGTIKTQNDLGHLHPAVIEISADIADSSSPFNGLHWNFGYSNGRLVMMWDEVPLYANMFTGSIPAIVRLDRTENLKTAAWEKMWYYSELRTMLKFRAKTRDIGAWSEDGSWLSWDTLCKGTEEEVFKDGGGPWTKDPA